MKFYVIHHKGVPYGGETIYPTLERAMHFLGTVAKIEGMNMSNFSVQEYEGWATCMRWRHGENIEKET